MASTAHVGIHSHVQAKVAMKRNDTVEKAVLQWIFDSIGEPLPSGTFEEVLHDGVALCKLINALKPGSVSKVAVGAEKFHLMENINKFLKAAQEYGVPHDKLFRTIDLFEKKNIPEVTGALIELARHVQKDANWKGPQLEKWVISQA